MAGFAPPPRADHERNALVQTGAFFHACRAEVRPDRPAGNLCGNGNEIRAGLREYLVYELEVAAGDLFRPCVAATDPQQACRRALPSPLPVLPAEESEAAPLRAQNKELREQNARLRQVLDDLRFVARQLQDAFRPKAAADGPPYLGSYPFMGLGRTYDGRHSSASKAGWMAFVLREQARMTVVAAHRPQDFCHSTAAP